MHIRMCMYTYKHIHVHMKEYFSSLPLLAKQLTFLKPHMKEPSYMEETPTCLSDLTSTCHSENKEKKRRKGKKRREKKRRNKIIIFLLIKMSPYSRQYFPNTYVWHPISSFATDLSRGLGPHWPTEDAESDDV